LLGGSAQILQPTGFSGEQTNPGLQPQVNSDFTSKGTPGLLAADVGTLQTLASVIIDVAVCVTVVGGITIVVGDTIVVPGSVIVIKDVRVEPGKVVTDPGN
jgi:hypothetical protein